MRRYLHKIFLVCLSLVIALLSSGFTKIEAKTFKSDSKTSVSTRQMTTRTNPLDLTNNNYQSENGVVENTTGVYSNDLEGWSYDEGTNTLTLSGMTLITDDKYPLVAQGNFKVVLTDGKNNKIESTYNDSASDSRGINAKQISFYGDTGTLDILGGKGKNSYGIYCESITMHGGHVTATGGDVLSNAENSVGVFFTKDSTILGGNLSAIAGVCGDDASSMGIAGSFDTDPSLTVTGGKLLGSAKKSNQNEWCGWSIGIRGAGNVIVTGGTAIGEASDALYSSIGIMGTEVEISGGIVQTDTGNVSWDMGSQYGLGGIASIIVSEHMKIQDAENENAPAYINKSESEGRYIISKSSDGKEAVKKVIIQNKNPSQINVSDNDSVTDVKSAIQGAIIDNDVVTVTGSFKSSEALVLNIPVGKTINWKANLTASTNTAISLSGAGTFNVISSNISSNANTIQAVDTTIVVSGTSQVKTLSSNTNAIQTNGNVEIKDRSQVLANNGYAIYASGKTSQVKVSGGLVFAKGNAITGKDNVVYLSQNPSGFKGVTNDAIIIAWKNAKVSNIHSLAKATSQSTYKIGSNTDLVTLPEKTAFWDNQNKVGGIRYSKGSNVGFLEIKDIMVVAKLDTNGNEKPPLISKDDPTSPKTNDTSTLMKYTILGISSLIIGTIVIRKKKYVK